MFELSPTNIMLIISIGSTAFAVYFYFRQPQEELEKKSILNEERDKGKATVLSQQTIENKANNLAQQAQWERELVEKRFNEMGIRINDVMTTAQNHIHTIDVKVDNLTKQMGDLTVHVTKLSTIIDERIPKK